MFSSERYRARAAEYVELAKKTDSPNEIHELRDLERSFTDLADNEEWLKDNFDKMVHAPDDDRPEGDALVAEEEHILRCLGAAVIMQWNNIPKKLQRELFDNAGSMGEGEIERLIIAKTSPQLFASAVLSSKNGAPEEKSACCE